MVADRLVPHVAQLLGVSPDDLRGKSLEELAQRVADERPQLLDELRQRAADTWDFRGMEPNEAHEVVALLLREGLVQAITVNWDSAIERAGMLAETRIAGVVTAAERLQLVHELPLYKVHGCAMRPATLAVTQEDVDKPQQWAVAQVQAALTGGVVVFVGLGTVGLYVREPIPELAKIWSEDDNTICVVDVALSDAWREALGDRADQVHEHSNALSFLDEILRAVVGGSIASARESADVLSDHDAWGQVMRQGLETLAEGLFGVTSDAVLRWWRDGTVGTQAGQPFITELPGQRALMTVGLLIGSRDVEVHGARGRLSVSTSQEYFEVVCRPGQHVTDVEQVAIARVERRREEGVYPDLDRLVTVVIADAVGEFPASTAPMDIAGSDDVVGELEPDFGPRRLRIVSAEDGVLGRLAA